MTNNKSQKNQFYENFMSRLLNNEEFDFKHNGIMYSVVHNPPYVYLGFNVVYTNGKYISEKVEKYNTIFDLIEQVRIDSRTIKEIWNDLEN